MHGIARLDFLAVNHIQALTTRQWLMAEGILNYRFLVLSSWMKMKGHFH
jgi:hypothetical protein